MISVIKANGEPQEFSESKLQESIRRAGIPQDLQPQVLEHVKSKLHNNMSTSEIYSHISEFLEEKQPYSKAAYSLKRALMDLGPTGHPFEDFAARVLQTQGYTTTVRTIIPGKCISHEIDVVAEKEKNKIMVEVKFHNALGIKTDVQVALYTQARFEDVKEKHNFTSPGLITNTKQTTDAIAYAECVGMKLLSWDYPEGESIRDIVNQHKLYPITVLSSLSQINKQELLNQGIILAHDICENPQVLDTLHLSPADKEKILGETKELCGK